MKLALTLWLYSYKVLPPDIFFGRNDWETKTKETIKNTKHRDNIY